jgi:hypothetical protein
MELITSENVIEAIYIAREADLLERLPPAPLLKSYLQDFGGKAQAVLKSGRYSSSAVVRIFFSHSNEFSVICIGRRLLFHEMLVRSIVSCYLVFLIKSDFDATTF